METSKKEVGKSILYNSIGSGIYLFCQWLITFIVVWVSGYKTAGILSIAMSVSTTFCVIATFNMRNYQSSDLKNKYSEKTYLTTRVFTSIIAVFVTLIYSLIKGFSTTQFLCINAYMIFKISEAIVDVLHGSLQKKWRFDIIGMSYICRGIISIVLFSLGLYFTNNLLVALLLMSVGVYIFIAFYDIRKYKQNIKDYGNFKKIYLVQLLIQCVPLVLYGLIFSYVAMYPKVFAEGLYGATTIGYYASVATPALIIQVAASFIFTPLISLFANYYDKKDYKKFNKEMFKIIAIILILCIVALVGSHFLADWALNLLFGKKILAYTYLFSGVIIISTLTAIIWFLGMLLVVIRNNKVLILGALLALVTACIVTPLFLEKYYLNGINATLILAYTIQIIIYVVALLFKKKQNNIKTNEKRVLHVLTSNSFSGAENVVCTIINNDKEYDMYYCCPKGPIEKTLKEKNIKYIPLLKKTPFYINYICKKYNIGILQGHDFKASFLVALSGFKGKIISHIHCNPSFLKTINIYTIAFMLVSNKFYKIITVSDEMKKDCIFDDNVKNKMFVIKNVVDKKLVEEKSKSYKTDKYDLIYVGRLCDVKNPIMVISITNQIISKFPNIRVCIIGTGDLECECKKLINSYHLEKNIDMLGFKENPYPYIKNSKIALLPSKSEGLPMSVIECMILNVPVLNSGVGGLKSLFKDNKKFVCLDQDAYCFAIEKIMAGDNTYKEICQDIIKESVNMDLYIKKINDVYK